MLLEAVSEIMKMFNIPWNRRSIEWQKDDYWVLFVIVIQTPILLIVLPIPIMILFQVFLIPFSSLQLSSYDEFQLGVVFVFLILAIFFLLIDNQCYTKRRMNLYKEGLILYSDLISSNSKGMLRLIELRLSLFSIFSLFFPAMLLLNLERIHSFQTEMWNFILYGIMIFYCHFGSLFLLLLISCWISQLSENPRSPSVEAPIIFVLSTTLFAMGSLPLIIGVFQHLM